MGMRMLMNEKREEREVLGNNRYADHWRQSGYRVRFFWLLAAFILCFFGSFMLGRYPVSPVTLVKIVAAQFVELEPTWTNAAAIVVLNVRWPRIVGAALIGAGLSAAGAAYQGMFRNPMVSPDILGASSGAGFGAAVAIFLSLNYFSVSVLSFLCGLVAVFLAYGLSRASRIGSALSMVLAGMMVSSLFTSATSLMKLVADTDEILPAITYWLMGSLASLRPGDIQFLTLPILLGLIVLFLLRWQINLLTLSEDEAESIGINVRRLRLIVIFCATLMTAASVSVSGLIGWVGLVIPHFCRMLFGYDYRRIIPASALLGATFLIMVDDVARLVVTREIPIGILTSFVGAPVFMWLILTGGIKRGH